MTEPAAQESASVNIYERLHHQMARLRVAGICVGWAILLVSFHTVAHGQERQEIHRSYDLAPGAVVALENISGNITISSWGESRAEVAAVKTGPAEQLNEVEVSIDAQPSRLAIKTIYPHHGNNRVSVSYNLKVPRSVTLDSIQSISGDIQISDIDGRVVANSVSGDVTVGRVGQDLDVNSVSGDATISNVNGRASVHSVSGDVKINDVNGDVEAKSVSGDVVAREVRGYMTANTVSGDIRINESSPTSIKASTTSGDIQFNGDLSADGRYNLKSHSGTVRVVLPPHSSFALQASTFSGKVDTDFEIRVQGPIEKRKLAGVVGQGGPTLDLQSFSGSVLLRKSGAK
jgi:DUF4097 and DUF4098 domain-containing protein YvlB